MIVLRRLQRGRRRRQPGSAAQHTDDPLARYAGRVEIFAVSEIPGFPDRVSRVLPQIDAAQNQARNLDLVGGELPERSENDLARRHPPSYEKEADVGNP